MTIPTPADFHANGKRKEYISLVSPVMEHIAGFILANAVCLECHKMSIRRTDTSPTALPVCTCEGGPVQYPMVQQSMGDGKELILCGSGPSLVKVRELLLAHPKADVWACNDALMWMTKRKYRVTCGVGIDQSPDLYTTCWTTPPKVDYLLATSVSHQLIAHLVAHGLRERIQLFHSFIGFEGEGELYRMLYQPAPMVAAGLNVVNRSLALADWMGYTTIYLVGVDCALGRGDIMHAGEKHKEKGIILRSTPELTALMGRPFATKPDMLVSAMDIVRRKREMGERLQLIGKTLPVALQDKDDAFLDRCIAWKYTQADAPTEVVKAAEVDTPA